MTAPLLNTKPPPTITLHGSLLFEIDGSTESCAVSFGGAWRPGSRRCQPRSRHAASPSLPPGRSPAADRMLPSAIASRDRISLSPSICRTSDCARRVLHGGATPLGIPPAAPNTAQAARQEGRDQLLPGAPRVLQPSDTPPICRVRLPRYAAGNRTRSPSPFHRVTAFRSHNPHWYSEAMDLELP